MLIDIYMKFHEDSLNSFQVIGWTRFCDKQTDIQTDAQGKNNMSPYPKVGRQILMVSLLIKKTFVGEA